MIAPELDALIQWEGETDNTYRVPNIIDFVCSDGYLNRPNLYPRQGTLLKVMFLQTEIMTDYDHEVIGQWEADYRSTANDQGEGHLGIVPGIMERIRINRLCPCGHDRGVHTTSRNRGAEGGSQRGTACIECECEKYRGRRWFREVVSVIGRRGSKGHIGALVGAYILHHFIEKGDPQEYYGLDRDKRMAGIVFGGKKAQAKAHQWRDLNNVIIGAPCFSHLISRPLSESLTIYSYADLIKMRERRGRGLNVEADQATFEITPKESTAMAGRGPASFLLYFDEVAHVVKAVAAAEGAEVYEAAVPALDQFGVDGFIYLPSSPWQRIGVFHEKYQQAIEMDRNQPVYPEMMMVQLPSWSIYEDWERAHEIPMLPSGLFKYPKFQGAIQSFDRQMEQLERANPETFRVERRAQFAAVLDAYLNPDKIEAMWAPWEGIPPGEPKSLIQQERGRLNVEYRAHGDPSKSGASFGFAIGHVEGFDDRELPHVVFDLIHHWNPADYEGHEIDYHEVGEELKEYLDSFMPFEMTFDQFSSVATIQMLQRHARGKKYPKRVQVYERTATGPLNWKTYEVFKTALGLGLLHGPFYDLANQELTFLQDLGGKVEHPTSGPVQSKDVADCLAIVTYELIGDQIGKLLGEDLSDLQMRPSVQGGLDQRAEEVHESLSSFGRGRSGIGRGRSGVYSGRSHR